MKYPKVTAIIQARMGSTRLPGKVLKLILDKPLLWHLIQRLKESSLVNEIIIATTNQPIDSRIIKFCKKYNIKSFQGSENNVLERYYLCANQNNAEIIVRITADCPLIDPKIVDQVISEFVTKKIDYLALATGAGVAQQKIKRFPDGLDCEVFTFEALENAYLNAKDDREKEHATMFIWKRPEKFKILQISSDNDYSNFRFVVDYPEDLDFVRAIYRKLFTPNRIFLLKDIVQLLKSNPSILKINHHLGNENYDELWKD